MKAKKYIKSTATMVAVKKYFNIKVIASIVASLMLLYTPVALYNYTKENGTLLYNVAEAQITSTVPIAKGTIKTQTEIEETSSYSVNNGFEEALENGADTYTSSDYSDDTNSQNTRPSSTPTTNNNPINNNQSSNNEVSKDLSFLKGTSITMVEGDSFDPIVNLGILAHDKDGTDITNRVSIDESTVDVNNEGSYYIKASVKLNDGSTLEKTFTVKVNPKKEVTYELNNFEMLENTAPKLGTARIFFDSKVSEDTVFPLKAIVNGVEYNVNIYGKNGFGGKTRHYIDVNVGDISGEFKLNIEKVEFSNGVSVWPGKQMNVYVIKSEPVVSNFSYTEDEEGKISTTFDLKDLDNSLYNMKVSLYNEKGILVQEQKVAKKEKYNLDFSVEANGKYTLEVIGDVNLYNDLSELNQNRVVLSEDIQVSKIVDKSEMPIVDNSKLEASDLEISVGEELNIDNLNIVASDKNGEDISSRVEIDDSKLDITNAGVYEVLLTVVNSDNIKLEKVVKVTVSEKEVSDIVKFAFSKTRNNESITDNNSEKIEENKALYKQRGIVSGNEGDSISATMKMTGNVYDDNGGAPAGRIEIELPTKMVFTVNQNGKFISALNHEIVNKSSCPVDISVVDFIEEDPHGGISILDNKVSDANLKSEVNLYLRGNTDEIQLYTGANLDTKIATINPKDSSSIILSGEAGKNTNQLLNNNGISENFTIKFKITKN